MKQITFGELLEQYIEITGEEEKREQLRALGDWVITYEKRGGAYDVLIGPPANDRQVK